MLFKNRKRTSVNGESVYVLNKQESKEFYKKVMILVLPMAIQNLINVGVNATDVIMLGKVGENMQAALWQDRYFLF